MRGRKRESPSPPPPDAAATTPFFARFLEGQHGDEEATLEAAPDGRTLKYPSDRDEIDWVSDNTLQARERDGRTLKYPSDRDEIDWSHGN